jgi:hypothetical protein
MFFSRRLFGCTALPLLLFVLSGCSETTSPDHAPNVLIRVGHQRVTVAEYHQALEIAKAAYPHNQIQKQSILQRLRLQVLKQMIGELIFCHRAAELNIKISEAELETVVASIQQSFPDDTFRQTLLENAIPYLYWEKRLKIRLLIEKVMARDAISETIEIQPETVLKKRLQPEAAQVACGEWIQRLQKLWPIEINMVRWREITAS